MNSMAGQEENAYSLDHRSRRYSILKFNRDRDIPQNPGPAFPHLPLWSEKLQHCIGDTAFVESGSIFRPSVTPAPRAEGRIGFVS
jgi:hypothetical protein